jgi:hypothetical protein
MPFRLRHRDGLAFLERTDLRLDNHRILLQAGRYFDIVSQL